MSITQIGTIALWILAILIPVQLIIGAVVARKSGQSASHYFISGKQLPLVLVFFADFATVMGVGNFIGYAGKGYEIGLNQFWMLAGEQGSKMIFAIFLAGMIGRYAYTTINEFLEKELFHDKWLRAIGGIMMTLPMICWTGAQAIGIGTLLSVVMGIDPVSGIWAASLTAILYTVMGGMWAIVWTDLLQGLIRIVVGAVFFVVVYMGVDGIGGIKTAVTAAKPELWSMNSLGFGAALSLLLTPLCGQFTFQAWWQRCFSAKDAKTAQRGFFWTAVFAIFMCSASIMVGMAAYTINPNLPRPDMAFSWMLTSWLNPVLAALLVVTIIGADMTVSAGLLNSGVTLLLMDVIKPFFKPTASDAELIKMGRWLTFVLGVGAVGVAFSFPSVLSAALFGLAVTGGGLFMPLVLGLLLRDKNGGTYITQNAAKASLILGGGTAAVFQYVPQLAKTFGGGIIPGICLSAVITLAVSVFEQARRKAKVTDSTNIQ
ncbi:sodium:solute symporter [Sporomusa aerivorans]|uniref:sodium:solute symporter family protein n=1 Tax=Sporomusa aerivorans TaxID=204936 RepID=UPI00352A277A